jgi:hypothetical protein
MKRKFLQYAGIAASVVLVAFGVGSLVIGINGRNTVRDNLALEQIVGSPDMTPAAIATAAKDAGLKGVALPTCSIAGKPIDTGSRAKCFASYMRVHALEATGGRTYSQMGQFLTAAGKETSNKTLAAKDPKTGQPAPNAARNVWITETALSTALNTSYFAESVSLFAIIMGFALLLTGLGLLVLTVRWIREPAAASRRTAARSSAKPAVV